MFLPAHMQILPVRMDDDGNWWCHNAGEILVIVNMDSTPSGNRETSAAQTTRVNAMAGTIVKRFSADTIRDLRTRAEAVSRALHDLPGGWSKSPVDPVQILDVFNPLRLKTGFVLQAYLLRSGGDGQGIVWALPVGQDLPDPGRRPKLLRWFLWPFKPSAALRNYMEAIEGNGTPFSYLSASIAARELAEFGAAWHFQSWRTENILDRDPWIEPPRSDECFGFSPSESWRLEAPRPEAEEWEPRVELGEDAATVTFITYSGHIEQRITRVTDRYSVGSYVFKTETTRLATGPRGYRF